MGKCQNCENHDCELNQGIESDILLHNKPGADKEVLFQNKRNVQELFRKDNRKKPFFYFRYLSAFYFEMRSSFVAGKNFTYRSSETKQGGRLARLSGKDMGDFSARNQYFVVGTRL